MVLMQSLPAVQYKLCRLSSINHNRKWQSRMYSISSCRNHTNTRKMLVKHTQSIHIKDNVCQTIKTSIQSFCKNPFDSKSLNAGNSIKLLNPTKHPTCCQWTVCNVPWKNFLPIKLRDKKSVLNNPTLGVMSSAKQNSVDCMQSLQTQDVYKYQHQAILVSWNTTEYNNKWNWFYYFE